MHLAAFRTLISRSILVVLFVRAGLVAAAPTFTVNSVFDVPADPNDTDYSVCRTSTSNSTCTLRAAIMKANHFAGGGVTINIPTNALPYQLTITPTGMDAENTGDLNILQSMTITGAGALNTIVDGNATDRVFRINNGAVVNISRLTVRNGNSGNNNGGGIFVDIGTLNLTNSTVRGSAGNYGGGIFYNESTLGTLTNVTVTRNTASGAGGGIANAGNPQMTVNSCSVYDNTAGTDGGGIWSTYPLTVNDCFVTGNHATGSGGGLVHGGGGPSIVINNSTFNANSAAGDGGGIAVKLSAGNVTLNNSTLSANGAQGNGGGIYNAGTAALFFTTVAGNIADADSTGGGGGGAISNASGTVQIWNSLLAENYTNAVANDSSNVTPVNSQDYNYIQSGNSNLSGPTAHNVYGGDILLDLLQSNGGFTTTRALLVGSPALDHIPAALCRDSSGTAPIPDQRHVARPAGSNGDMGAFEGSIQPIYNRSLVRNGDAENGAGSPTGAKVGVPNWTVTAGQFTAVPYNAAGGYPNTTTDVVPSYHAYNFFAGGNTPLSTATQTIDVSPIASKIDSGNQTYNLGASFGGYTTDADAATLTFTFLNSSAAQLGSQVILGPYAPSDRGNVTGFKFHGVNGNVPAGTRSVKVDISMSRSNGTTNDAYLDGVAFILTPPAALGNISTRAFVQTGDNVMIGGFIVTGSGAKRVLVRAIGPSLSGAGIVNPLQNPTLELHDGTGALIAFNDNWGDSPNAVDIANSGLAPSNSLESAIFASLNPGVYTGIVQGLSNGTGIGLIEAYDMDRTTLSKLGNISTRALVQTGDNVMIGGLIVRSPGSEDVVVRVIGPSLSSAGIPNPLADPVLELHDENGALIAFNDNWKDTQQTQIQATGLAPSNNAEPAIVRTLTPALYTAVVVGKNNTSGVALVEVYGLN
jgi:hypothetical protein